MKAAMTERIASYHDKFELRGIPNQRLLNMYQKWGHGEFGVVLTGNIATHPTHLEFAGNMIVCKENADDELKKWFTEMAKIIKAEGSLAVAQLTNAGRQTPEAIERHPFSASDVQLTKPEAGRRGKPVPLTIEQIKTEVIDRYTFAAEFLYQCGFDGVQIHGAHGYLFSQFLSPTTNKRTDQYGGPIENRARVFLETYQSIRSKIPESTGFIVGVKINSVEFQNEGLETNDAKRACELLEKIGYDFVELSGGTMEHWAFSPRDSTKQREGFFLEFADEIRLVFKNAVIYVTGGFRTAKAMVDAVKSGSTQGIGLGRPIANEPDLPKKILSGKVNSAIRVAFPEDDFRTTVLTSNSNMFAMGENPLNGNVCSDLFDFSDPKEAERFLAGIKEYAVKFKENDKNLIPNVGVYEHQRSEESKFLSSL